LTASWGSCTIERMSTPVPSAPADGRVAQRLLLLLRHGASLGAFVRFLFAGATNTLLTGLLLIVLARWMDMEIAYTIVFSAGLAFMTLLAGPFVFRSKLSGRAVGYFVSWYLCVYLTGVVVARLATRQWHVSHLLTAVAIIAVTAPLNFLGGRRAFLTTGRPPQSSHP
jgi:putative flippase GtrA